MRIDVREFVEQILGVFDGQDARRYQFRVEMNVRHAAAAARTAALEEAAQLVENECECSHGSSLYDAAARIRALKGTP